MIAWFATAAFGLFAVVGFILAAACAIALFWWLKESGTGEGLLFLGLVLMVVIGAPFALHDTGAFVLGLFGHRP